MVWFTIDKRPGNRLFATKHTISITNPQPPPKQLLKSISEKSNVATTSNFRLSCTIDWFSPAGSADDEGWEENYGGDVLTQFSAQAEGHNAH